jgi:Ca-activated chloride channel family protein
VRWRKNQTDMKILLFMLGSLCSTAFWGIQTTSVLQGTVTEKSTGEALIGASVKISKNDVMIRGAVTDYEGNYRVQLEPGTYDIEISYTGFAPTKISGVQVLEGRLNQLDCAMDDAQLLQTVDIVAYKVPIIQKDITSMGLTLTSEEIRSVHPAKKSATKKGKGKRKEAQSAPNTSIDGSQINVKGSRSTGTNYYIDGNRVQGTPPPVQDISGTGKKMPPPHDESPENYDRIIENQFIKSKGNATSTFSIDVDGASYANARRFLNSGQLPPRDAVRIEEFVNYFDYQYPQPSNGKPFAVHTELVKCPWNSEHQLLSVNLQGREIETGQLPASNFVFLVDVSGSMNEPNKLPLVQSSLMLLTDYLRPQDRVALVVYAGAAGLVLPSTPGNQKEKIKHAIESLGAGGSTAGAAGIQLAYQTARENFAVGGNNRVILCTDGDFNVGVSDNASLVQLIENERQTGIYLSILGFGMGNYQDSKMQQLADKGNGNHAYIDQLAEAQKVLISEFGGTLFAIAKDVKIQIEFNSDKVAAYRLIGYENRMLAREDFDDDTKDAGEMGAGHRVTALYEIISAGQNIPIASGKGGFTYEKTKPATGSKNADLLTLKLRYKQPKVGARSELIKTVVPDKESETMSENLSLAAAAASFGLVLRNSAYKGDATFESALLLARASLSNDASGYRAELCKLIQQAQMVR